MIDSLIILGPTAAGKSKLAIDLAQKINAEIISADSMQVYRGMDIGTAKPSVEQQHGIPHHLINVRNPDQEWTVSDFVREAQISKSSEGIPKNSSESLRDKIQNKGKLTIIVGGTGLYLWALLKGFSFPIAPANKEIRARLEKEPLSTLYSLLCSVDPKAAEKIHQNDKKRIIRALEVYELTGKPITELQRAESRELRAENIVLIGITLSRDQLYQRIEERVDKMIEKGLIAEVKGLLAKGFSKDLSSFQALGYKEVVEYLDGKWTKEQMIAELKKRTRNFARRQMTWFKRFKEVKWFEAPFDTSAILDYINNL